MSRIPKPPNMWIIFRSEMSAKIDWTDQAKPNFRPSAVDVSRRLSAMWKEITPAERAYYQEREEQERVKHQARYPDYVYCIRKRSATGAKKIKAPVVKKLDRSTNQFHCPATNCTLVYKQKASELRHLQHSGFQFPRNILTVFPY